nr:spore coat protein CotJB [uncultured Romboutsia sp.]
MAQSHKSSMILKIQELSFACVDLNLYLDNHPDDANAVSMYNSFSKQLNEAIRNYECKYGPLTNFGYGKSSCPWQWVEQPWPWDREFNC